MVYFHGIHEDLGEIFHEIECIPSNSDISVLAVEYPGYGVHWDHGICSEKRMLSDAKHVITYLMKELMISGEDIILFGRSMGTGVVA